MIRRIDDALDDEARLRKALREHLGSSPVWQGIERWNKACSEFDKDRLGLQSRATLAAEQAGLLGGDHPDGMVQILRQDTGHRLCGFPVVELTYDPVNGKAVAMGLPKASGDAGSEMRRRFDQLRGELPQWPEFKRLQSTFDRARQVRAGLDDELAAIVLRRVIAGDCWLCPLGASKRRKEVGQS